MSPVTWAVLGAAALICLSLAWAMRPGRRQ